MAIPGGKPRHFWEDTTHTSIPSLSISSFIPPMELTPSTHHTTSGYLFSILAKSSMGLVMPVVVSLWVMVIKSYLPVDRTSSTIWGVIASPFLPINRSAWMLFLRAISYQRVPKKPLENTAALFLVNDRIAPSIIAVPDDVDRII